MPPRPMTSLMQFGATVAAPCLAASLAYWTVSNANSKRNADLVSIGVGVLRADPSKEPQTRSAQERALDLIDANAGGVRFSASIRCV